MQQLETHAYQERLLKEQRRLRDKFASVDAARTEIIRPPGEASNLPTHPADQSVGGLTEHLALQHTLRGQLREIKETLGRIQDGSYGQCQRCGGKIPRERLDAIPYTPFCIKCEQAQEER